jgi:hypothetical protein
MIAGASVIAAALSAVVLLAESRPILDWVIVGSIIAMGAFAFLLGGRNFNKGKFLGPTPLVCDAEGVLAPTFFGDTYVAWSEVARLDFEPAVGDLSKWAGLYGFGHVLSIRTKSGRTRRLSVPPMSMAERDQLRAILEDLAHLHRFLLRWHPSDPE